jgi:uncharacterized protein
MNTIEQKQSPTGRGYVIKTSGDGLAEGQFEGWASTYGGSPDLQGDVIARNAFSNTLREKGDTFPLDWAHDVTSPIGIVQAVEKERGLWVKGTIALDVQRGREAWSLLKLGAIGSMSIGFSTIDSDYSREGHRVIKEIDLYEVSLVQHPANIAAVVERVKNDPRQLEALLSYLQGATLTARNATERRDAEQLRLALRSIRVRA